MAKWRTVGGREDDSEEKQRWIDRNNRLSAPKHQNKSLNPNNTAHFHPLPDQNTSSQQQQRFHTVASDDSSSRNPTTNQTSALLPGYVRFDSKVRISLNLRSKLEIRELKRKLVTELDQVRKLKKKLETKEATHYKNNASANREVGTLARVNSEVSYVGPATAQSLDNHNHSHHYANAPEHVDKAKKTKNANQFNKNYESKLKPGSGSGGGGGGKRGGSGGETMGFTKELARKSRDVLGKLMKHQYGWVFNAPVDAKKLKLHDYYSIIKRPMDLGTVKSRLNKNWYKSPKEFAEDVRLTFNNAMTFNVKGQDVHTMAEVLLKIFEENWAAFKAKLDVNQRLQSGQNASLSTSASKRAPVPPASTPARAPLDTSASAPTPPVLQMPLEATTLDGLESTLMPVNSNLKGSNVATNKGMSPVSKKPKAKAPGKRDMTYEEKQQLSTNLQDLPSERLETVVQIIKKRNPGLVQHDDEIEVDIDSFDAETLWELDTFISNYNKTLNKDKRLRVTLQEIEETDNETNLISATAQVPKEAGAVEKIVATSPAQGRKQGDSMSRSNSSGSSSDDSGSFSSESGNDSSSDYGSDAGQCHSI